MRYVLVLIIAILSSGGTMADSETYTESIEAWRSNRMERLTAADGYLAVAGFFWLEAERNTIGTAQNNQVILPAGTGPGFAGALSLLGNGRAEVRFENGVKATIDGKQVTHHQFDYDAGGSDRMQIGRVTFWVMERGGRAAVRLLDPECPLRKNFDGIDHFVVNPEFRVMGTWKPLQDPGELRNMNFLGYEESSTSYGQVEFELGGKTHRLTPFQSSAQDSVLFLVFADETTSKETYGGGRFLYGQLAEDGSVELDFNKAYNPPCAFNPHTTCPLPPEDNKLALRITAGEKAPPSH